jgi:hypothetical protein
MTEGKILFAAVRLSEVGVVLVGILFAAAAVGKWKKRIAFRVMAWSCALGGVTPFLIFATSMFINAHGLSVRNTFERFTLVLWPSSIGLMGLEGPGPIVFKLLFVAVLVLMNMGLYGLVGVCIGFAWQKFRFQKTAISGGI